MNKPHHNWPHTMKRTDPAPPAKKFSPERPYTNRGLSPRDSSGARLPPFAGGQGRSGHEVYECGVILLIVALGVGVGLIVAFVFHTLVGE